MEFNLKDLNIAELTAQVIAEVNEYRKAQGINELTESQKNRSVGNNGIAIGDIVTFTGEIDMNHPVEINGKIQNTYPAAKTVNGAWVSLASILGLSSLNGYKTSGTYPHTKRESKANNAKIITEDFEAKVIEDFDFNNVFKPFSRNLYEFGSVCKATNCLKDVSMMKMGYVVRPYTAKTDSPATSLDIYKKGDARCMASQLWGEV